MNSSRVFSATSGTDLSHALLLIHEAVHTNISKLDDEYKGQLQLVAAKIHLVITKDKQSYIVDQVIKNDKKNAELLYSIIQELDSTLKKIGMVLGRSLKYELDIFFKSKNKKYVWYREEHINRIDSENGEKQRSRPLSKKKLQDYYDQHQAIAQIERIQIFDKYGKLNRNNDYILEEMEYSQIHRKSSSEKKLSAVDKF